MSANKKVKLEFDTDTIQAISSLCELSGLEMPEVIKTDFIEKVQKRIKEILLNLKKQGEESNEEAEKLKKEIEKLNKKIEKLQGKLETDSSSSDKSEEKAETKEEKDKDKEDKNKDEEKGKAKETSKSKGPRTRPSEIKNILIIANLGVIMHQLKILFSKFGCKVSLVKNYTEAIGELKNNEYDCILFDMPTTTENDIMLLEALRKATEICETDTIVVALILPPKDKNIPNILRDRGADVVIDKHESWHMNILTELELAS